MANKKSKIAMEVGAGLLAAGAAAAAGYYFFAHKDAEKNRKIVKSWAAKLKKDVEREVQNLKTMEKDAVANVIDKVKKGYEGLEDISVKELNAAATELKNNWERIAKPRKSVKSVKGKSGNGKAAKKEDK